MKHNRGAVQTKFMVGCKVAKKCNVHTIYTAIFGIESSHMNDPIDTLTGRHLFFICCNMAKHRNKAVDAGNSKSATAASSSSSSGGGLNGVKGTIEGELVSLEFVDKPCMTRMLGRLSAFAEGKGKGK